MSCRRLFGCWLAAVAIAGALPAAATAAEPGPSVPACALGKLPRPLEQIVPRRIAKAEERFVAGLDGVGPKARDRARRAFATAEAAYLYGWAPVATRLTVARFPLNVMIGVGHLSTAESRAVVTPNADTLYSVSRIELGSGPLVLDAPATGGRYSVIQLLDAYTNAAGYVGAGRSRDDAESVLLAGPDWHGEVPSGLRLVRSPTNLLWLLGRTLVDGPDDVPAAAELMGRYALTPLDDWQQGARNHEIVLGSTGAQPPIEVPADATFYDKLSAELAASPAPGRDDCAMKAFARIGIGPGEAPSATTDPIVVAALGAAPRFGLKLIERATERMNDVSRKRNNGWSMPPDDTARFGTDYAGRAVVAWSLLAANRPEQALYPAATTDSGGRVLRGRNRYVIRFPADRLPPVRAFWSMTMYNADFFLVRNPLDRYAIGDRSPDLDYGRDGSLTIYVQHDRPRAARVANWLPAPHGRFSLRLRLFEPRASALGSGWKPPRVERVKLK